MSTNKKTCPKCNGLVEPLWQKSLSGICLDCGKDNYETLAARAYDFAKALRDQD